VPLANGTYMLLLRSEVADGVERVVLQDPNAVGEPLLALDRHEFERVWTHEVVLVKRNYDIADVGQPFGLGLVVSFILRERRVVFDVAISAVMLSFLALAPIMFWRLMTDRVLPYHAFSTFWVISLVMVMLIAFETCFSALRRYLLVGLTTRVDVRLSTYMFEKVLNLPVDYFETTPTGFTLHQMGQIGRIRSFLLGQLFGTVLDAGILVIFLPVMAFFSLILTAIVLGLCAIIVCIIVIALPALRRRGAAVEHAEAGRGAMLAQTIQGMRTVKSLALDARQRHEWDVLTARVARARMTEGHLSNLVQTAVMPIERLAVSGSLAVGVYMAMQSQDPVAVGTLFAFVMLSQRIAQPLIQVSQLVQQYDEARIALAVVSELVNQPPEEGRSGNGVRKPILGHIEFQSVLFTYKGALRPALKNLSFEVPRGTTLGVMGRSGSGKTTITRLLQRLHSDYSGLIKIDGVDVRQYDIDYLRSSLGVVLQENFLFSGTIRENITISKPDASYDDMVLAARMAGAEEFIDKLPAGYETFVYEGSPNLSGGQRQRLAIARALITDPKILILDEATSALDAESEAIVNANIERIAQGRSVITISHRLAALVKCDAIMVLDGGVINDIGRHEELLERNDIYAGLWYTQNQHAGAAPGTSGQRSQPRLAYRGPN
jgi:ATP-binding cassette subfamily B protein